MGHFPRGLHDISRLMAYTFREFRSNNLDLLAAGLGFFSLFSLVPLMIIGTAALGLVWSHHDPGVLLNHLAALVSDDVAYGISEWLTLASGYGKGKATAFSGAVLALAASRIFTHIRTALNLIWKIRPKEQRFAKRTAMAFLGNLEMLIGIVLFMFSFVVLDAGVVLVSKFASGYIPGIRFILELANLLIPIGLATLLCAAAYKFVPSVSLRWADVLPGAIVSAAFLAIGKVAISLYLRWHSFSTLYGAASSIILVLIWIYFAAQIFFFGAQFSCLYAQTYGSHSPASRP